MMDENFAAFILTHGRPDSVITYRSLKKCGYTGKIYIVIDDEDVTAPKYYKNFGEENVIMFSKTEIAKRFDEADNFGDRRTIVYARNACFDIAESLGIQYFIQLDDDYTYFDYRFDNDNNYNIKPIKSLDKVFSMMLKYFKSIPSISSIAMAQGGDFIGGGENKFGRRAKGERKCMNTFICSTNRRFDFIGRVNEDVNTYVHKGSTGMLFLTIPGVSITQKTTQSREGGMTETYLDKGTYVKSFYTVLFSPSSARVSMIVNKRRRLHHRIHWNNSVPLILNDMYKKGTKQDTAIKIPKRKIIFKK